MEKTIINSSIPITCNPKVLQHLVDIQLLAYKEGKKNLSQNLIDELTHFYGSPNKTLGLEFLTKLWTIRHNELTFNIFSAKGKGTTIEICDYSYEELKSTNIEMEIIEFLNYLYISINNNL